jgi:plasmid stabilization system protein ParE
MDYSFHPHAEKEVDEIVEYYDDVEETLGDEFFSELQNTIARVLQLPDAWQRIWPSARRCLLNRFPYQLVYQERPEGILIVAVMHLSREPNCWVDRL